MSSFGISLECEHLLPVEKRPCHKMVSGWLCVTFRRATIRCERAFGFRLFWHDQYMTANPLCRIPKTPQIAGFSRFGCGLRSRSPAPSLAINSPNSLSLSLALWTSRLSRPQDDFRNSLEVNKLRVVSGERFYGVNACPAGCERVRRERNRIVIDRNAQ